MKYKQAEPEGWFVKIFDDGTKTPSWNKKGKPGYYQEMQDWIAAGNEIEPFETEAEIAEREAKEAEQAIENQRSQCARILKETDHKMLPGYQYPDDVPKWALYRSEICDIMKADSIREFRKKPF